MVLFAPVVGQTDTYWQYDKKRLRYFQKGRMKHQGSEVHLGPFVSNHLRFSNHLALSEPVAYSGAILQKLINEEGVVVKVIPDDALIAIGNAAGQIIADQIASDPWSAKIFASMSKFRSDQIPYTDTTEGEVIRARKLPYSFPS